MSTRRGFLGMVAAFIQLPKVSGNATANCPHDWSKGPFYVSVAQGVEEPEYYPPSGLLRTEHCKLCGALRLPKAYWDANGDSLDEVVPAQGTWKCKARAANMGANDPQDCDWPVCGCDPHADKVIEALQESGKLK